VSGQRDAEGEWRQDVVRDEGKGIDRGREHRQQEQEQEQEQEPRCDGGYGNTRHRSRPSRPS
jgi:hypothetical protein